MATGSITNTVTDPSGTAVAGVRVVAKLLPAPGFLANGTEVAGEEQTVSNASGSWSLTLTRNSDITPANTYYEITEYIPYGNRIVRTIWTIQAAAGSQTVQQAQIVTVPPQPALTAAAGHGHTGSYVALGPTPTGGDDTATLQGAIDALSNAGGGNLLLIGEYRIETAGGIALRDGVTLLGAGPGNTVLQEVGGGTVIKTAGTVPAFGSPTTTLSTNTAGGETTLTVVSTAAFSVGAYAILGDNATPDPGHADRYNGEMVRILSVDSATGLTINGVVRDVYTTARNAALWKIVPVSGIGVKNLTIRNLSPLSGTGDFIRLTGCVDVEIENVILDAADGPGIQLTHCASVNIDRIKARDLANDTGASRFGYGVNITGACDSVVVSNSVFHRCRHAVTTNGAPHAGQPRNILITGCIATECSSASFDTHAHGSQITFSGCQVVGGRFSGFQIRSRDTRVIGCSVSWVLGPGIQILEDQGHGVVLKGNVLRHIHGSSAIAVVGAVDCLTIEDNTIDAVKFNGIYIDAAATSLRILRNSIYNVGMPSGLSGFAEGIAFGAVTSAGHRIEGNIGGNVASATEPNTSPGKMRTLVTIPATVTGSWVANNTAVGLSTANVVSDAGSNFKLNNLALDATNPWVVPEGVNIVLGTGTGTKIGTATTQKFGFYNATPVAKQTGVAVTAAAIHAALVNLGLIGA